ncbi:stage II sporulation protein P [Robertmurraya kyonggiensis]|uniref:stage II sporulation protein P n=1 Tax=Robertmurraya kyonggiensis TaxID=1037680 RepID=UPI00130ED3E0|nr:stage II sporulation protein P [Robertmurraya kyonggiensis]
MAKKINMNLNEYAKIINKEDEDLDKAKTNRANSKSEKISNTNDVKGETSASSSSESKINPSKSLDNKISQELEPDIDSLKKNATINQKKIDSLKDMEIKTPKIEHGEFHSTFGKEVAFIYFSHNRESFLPYFSEGTKPEEAYHSEFNVSLIGERLGSALKFNGVWNSVDQTDIITMLNSRGLNFNSSYQMSRELVIQEKRENRNLEMLFDIHRDSLPKKYTTQEINGEPFAKILFVVGSGHKNYEKNLAFTNSLNDLINKSYPGLSRGVIIKDTTQGNGIYNQDLTPNSVIIEIGGVDNTIDELYRTADVLGYVIGQYYWNSKH